MSPKLSNLRRRYFLTFLGALSAALLTMPAAARAQDERTVAFERIEDVIYGRKFGTALTMDIFKPTETNAQAGLIFVASGGWYSSKGAINPDWMQPFLRRGYTVFAAVHGSQPRYIIPEIAEDIHRAVRFVRHRARDYRVSPGKLGIFGGSAGGHLTLTLATQGGSGKPDAKDPVERESSEVQAAACFFPLTDFLNYGEPGVDAVGVGVLEPFKAAFGPRASAAESRQVYGREISPIYFVHSNVPPVLIIHGDADKLVPYQQAASFVEHCRDKGVDAQLIAREGQAHGWAGMEGDLELFGNWFDRHLLQPKEEVEAAGKE